MADEILQLADQEKIEEAIGFLRGLSSVVLGTVGQSGEPHTSYAPYIAFSGCFYVYVSGLAEHARTLKNGRVSLFFIEDEAQAKNLFARKRLTISCGTAILASDHHAYPVLLDRMEAAHGSTFKLLRNLPDFLLFELTPEDARFVTGFGAAYDISASIPQLAREPG